MPSRRAFLLITQFVHATALIAALLPLANAGAAALERREMMALPVHADARMEKSHGRLEAFLRRLNEARHACRLSNYAYGGDIDCGSQKEPRVLIGFVFAPTHAPEFIEIHSIRANGINGDEMLKTAPKN